jgi:hypothetical protein
MGIRGVGVGRVRMLWRVGVSWTARLVNVQPKETVEQSGRAITHMF